MVTPPTRDGRVNPHLLVAARKVGVSEIYKIGSAWAIAALTYGTETVPKVDIIVGPGNQYVTLAKKIVAGTVGIDMVAGPVRFSSSPTVFPTRVSLPPIFFRRPNTMCWHRPF